VKVRLFSREYTIRGQGDRKYVERLAEFINAKAEEVQRRARVISTLDLVILTLLNVTDEMFRYKRDKEEAIKKLEEKTEKLGKAIDRVI
jgi:cell division protein ZapA (FtsZ GTPase activity inhibitor)